LNHPGPEKPLPAEQGLKQENKDHFRMMMNDLKSRFQQNKD